MIIAFFAPKQSGKSTAAHILMQYLNAQIVSFASPLKKMGTQMGLDCYVEKDKMNEEIGMTGRQFAIQLGDFLRHSIPTKEYSCTTLIAKRKIEKIIGNGRCVVI